MGWLLGNWARHIAVGVFLLALCCILTGLFVRPALAVDPAAPSGYSLKWSNEFNGASFNRNMWQEIHPGTTLPNSYQARLLVLHLA